MPAKDQTPVKTEAATRQQPLHPVSADLDNLAQQPDKALLVQRARLDPRSLTSREVQRLQHIIGNHSVQRMFDEYGSPPSPLAFAGTVKRASQKGIGDDEDVPIKKDASGAVNRKRAEAIPPVAREESHPKPSTAALAGQEKISAQKGITEDEEDVPIKTEAAKVAQPMTASGHRFVESPFAAGFGAVGVHQDEVRRTDLSLLQRQPAPPAPAPTPPATPAPAGRAGLNYLAVLKDKVPGGWGVTTQDDPVIDITAYSDGTAWKCVITKADQRGHQGVRLLAGVTELTGVLVAAEADCGKLTTMAKSLKDVANQGTHSGFYMISAVQAHEDLHITQYRTPLNALYTTLKAAVEALTVPFAGNADAGAAKAAIKALPAFTTAKATFTAGELAANNATASHSPMAPFSAVELVVVTPMITTIDARKVTLKCAP